MPGDPIRILIADDHEVVREGLRLILEAEDDFEVAGEAADGVEAVRLAAELTPQVVLMDLRMPGMDGLEAIGRIRAAQPGVALVILTTYNEDKLIRAGLLAGARGYLLKDMRRQALYDTVRAAARGEALLMPDVMARLLGATAPPAPAPRAHDTGAGPGLTERELQVLAGLARGERNKEIAARLFITERTVKAHLASIYNKLGVDSRAAAVAEAAARGLIPSAT